MKVAILGTGPSAAFAYRACLDGGVAAGDITVHGPLSERPHGYFYLHWLPASVRTQAVPLRFHIQSIGTREGYAHKIWGREDIKTSFPSGQQEEKGFEATSGLRALWGTAQAPVPERQQQRLSNEEVAMLCRSHSLVIRTFPPPLPRPLAVQVRPCSLLWAPLTPPRRGNTVQVTYNGVTEDAWVRRCRFPDEESMEIAGPPPRNGAAITLRPNAKQQTWPDLPPQEHTEFWEALHRWLNEAWRPSQPHNLFNVGRYATFQRKALSHETYHSVFHRL